MPNAAHAIDEHDEDTELNDARLILLLPARLKELLKTRATQTTIDTGRKTSMNEIARNAIEKALSS